MTEHIINDIEQAMQSSLNNEQMLLLHQVMEFTMHNVDVTIMLPQFRTNG